MHITLCRQATATVHWTEYGTIKYPNPDSKEQLFCFLNNKLEKAVILEVLTVLRSLMDARAVLKLHNVVYPSAGKTPVAIRMYIWDSVHPVPYIISFTKMSLV